MLSFSISYSDLIICLYFADTTEREDLGWGVWKKAQRQGEDRVTLRITLIPWSAFGVFGCHLLEHKHNLVFTHPSGRYYWRGVVSTVYPVVLILREFSLACEFSYKILRKKSFMGFLITKFAKNILTKICHILHQVQ